MTLKLTLAAAALLLAAGARAEFHQWAPTPPMGWNSWDCYGPTVVEDEVKANADYLAEHLKPHGWEYVVVDIRWFVENDKAGGYNQRDPRYVMDGYGRYLPAVNRFPSAAGGAGFKALADYVHGKGLKFGIHVMRGVPKIAVEQKLPVKGADGVTADQIYSPDRQCGWLKDNYTIVSNRAGAQEYYNSIFELYAGWGVDFVKVDDLAAPYHQGEIELIRRAIDRCGRPMVLSISPGPTPLDRAAHVSAHANMWRLVGDLWDEWTQVKALFGVTAKWLPHSAPGAWPDCDMLPLGRLAIRGERGADRPSRLTRDEQHSLMTLLTISRSPLMFGGDLPSNDAFTLSLLTNRAVLAMHRESAGAKVLFQDPGKIALTARHPGGAVYLALFNLQDHAPQTLTVKLSDIGFTRGARAANLWTGEQLGALNGEITSPLAPHACALYRLEE
jgi:hypothetical protein